MAELSRAVPEGDLLRVRQEELLRQLIGRLFTNSPFYRAKLRAAGIEPGDITTLSDLDRLPFTTKEELREAYPLGLMAVPEEAVVRIHSSSGTTGKPVIVPYTAKDVEDWTTMFARCYTMAGVGRRDRVQVTPGYGLWTAGIGFQTAAERIGAMVVPMGPGNTEKQLQMMVDLETTVLTATSSYALLLAEEINRRGLRERIKLKRGILGSERWSDRMRARIEKLLGIETFDIYGMTEVYGPGIAIDCPLHRGLHYWADYLLFEVIDPETGREVPPGTQGELVITTLVKEGMPLLRYRTRDITRLIPTSCPCGSPYPMIDRILGRTDDMIKIKGVNIYPGQIDFVLKSVPGLSSEYQIILTREAGRDQALVKVEGEPGVDAAAAAAACRNAIKTHIGVTFAVEVVPFGSLPRSEKKTQRVFDLRET
ncbi:phenylacetate--CoA ligase family protein [Thermodesulfitimonas autotrophica]|uniref:phenylacetate--CoA ligase family protein n=1 Tax=Thermodesulfitimonas autotrophica TaxID=1894989 RepID=UPI002FE21D2C